MSEPTLSKYLRRPDWPAKRKGPWGEGDLAKAAQWKALLQDDRSGKAAPPAAPVGAGVNLRELRERQKILLDKERTRKAKVDADLAEGMVVPRDLLDRALVGLTRLFVEKVRNAEAALPRHLEGKKRRELQAALREYFDRMRQDLVDSAAVELATAEDELLKLVRGKSRSRGKAAAAAEAASG